MMNSCDVAIVGAGPYGLSLAAHLREAGVSFRIFGRPMQTWREQMPKGMYLKSDGFASNLSDPRGNFTLGHYCGEHGIEYSDESIPVRLDTFVNYGLAFGQRMVASVEERNVVRIEQTAKGFSLKLDDGQTATSRRLVLAVGITHFAFIPELLAALPSEVSTHGSMHHDLSPMKGRSVAVIGAGASAIDLAGLLHEAGARVQLIARRQELKFHGRHETRSLWKRLRHPKSGIGPGLRSRIYTDAPLLFHLLPGELRRTIVRKHLGPAAGWFSKDLVMGKVELHLGCNLQSATVSGGKVQLGLSQTDGGQKTTTAEHVISATGYRVDVSRLGFLSPELQSRINTVGQVPVLSRNFETSVPGLFMVGPSAANSFGPVMRFAFGSAFTARHLSKVLVRTAPRASTATLATASR
jgi:thioredoxin reductase